MYDFLARLNDIFDQIRVQVLGRDPFSSLRQAYNYVQQEESRRNAMLPTTFIERTCMLFDSSTIITKFDTTKTESTKET